MVALALAAGACGGESADLFAVDRSGDIPGARLRLIVDNGGGASCNDGEKVQMPSELLLEARELRRDLEEPEVAGLNLPPGPRSVLRYDAQTSETRVRFADDSRNRPKALDELAYFVRRVAQDVCGLPR